MPRMPRIVDGIRTQVNADGSVSQSIDGGPWRRITTKNTMSAPISPLAEMGELRRIQTGPRIGQTACCSCGERDLRPVLLIERPDVKVRIIVHEECVLQLLLGEAVAAEALRLRGPYGASELNAEVQRMMEE